ncbi:MAG TPA: hypothetical protein PKV59_06890, partial [Flexilinea sp.]|nr:hypothetical protein [Flexilinea sp.]
LNKVSEFLEDRKGLLIFSVILLLSTMTIFIFSSDWGRLAYLYGFNIYLSLVVLKEHFSCEDSVAGSTVLSGYQTVQWIAFFILFTGTWFLKMYVDGGNIALQQGLIFKILDWISI